MTVQFWVGDFFVDISRNQITRNEHTQTIAPKALAVLTCLAENQGKVVSQAALLTEVWQETAVTANTLQRSIAQLRKALGDDGKVQCYIKTHAKQGYSLESEVRWHHTPPTDSESVPEAFVDGPTIPNSKYSIESTKKQTYSGSYLRNLSMVTALITLILVGYRYVAREPVPRLTFDSLRSLTATDDKEFDATYTPDGQYIVFHRYLDNFCTNTIIAKHIDTQQEIQLTKDWGHYGSHSFSKDGKTLIFLATKACSAPFCYNLVSIDFEKALESPQEPTLILQCKNSRIRKPTWLNNGTILLLQKTSNRWKLINYLPNDDLSIDLYDPGEGTLNDYTYSVNDDLIAVMTIHNDDQHYLEMIEPNGRIVSSNPLDRSQVIPKFRSIYPSFDPLHNQLIFSTGRQLFTLSYEGKIDKVSLPFTDRMVQPEFHPRGKRILFIKGPYDSDIVKLSRESLAEVDPSVQTHQAPSVRPQLYPSFERSTLGEDYAVFQPGGPLIAFWSERSGEEQVWISDGHGPQQLTHFQTDTYINGIDWAADGQSLLVNANHVLTRVNLASEHTTFPLAYPVVQLFQWDSANHRALALVRIKGITKFVEVDLQRLDMRVINDKHVTWALKSEDGRIIYKDHHNHFWQPGPAEAQRIGILDRQGDRASTFLIQDNVIYAINSKHQLWSYDLDHASFTILGELHESVDYLTDINQTEFLLTIEVAAKKEVVELTLSE